MRQAFRDPRWYTCLALSISLLASRAAFSQEPVVRTVVDPVDDLLSQVRSSWILPSKAQVIEKVSIHIDPGGHAEQHISCRMVTLSSDNTPFLHAKLVDRPIWHVTIRYGKLKLPSALDEWADLYDRVFDTYVDPRTGRILKIVSRWPHGVARSEPEPPADYAERQIGGPDGERYHGFPDEPPRISFMEALDVVLRHGFGNPLTAKQIVAQCVTRSYMGDEPKPVWVITLRGIPPLRPELHMIPTELRDHIRHIIDARTGRWIEATTKPQPELAALKKEG